MRNLLSLITALILFPGSPVFTQIQLLTPENLWKTQRVGVPVISPDKNLLAYTVTKFNIDENKGYTDIYIYNTVNATSKRLTTHKAGESSPQWSPDGKKISFLSKREDDERSQIYLIPVDGGEAERLTEAPMGVSSVKWDPTGNYIWFASKTIKGLENDPETLKKEIKKKKDSKVSAKVTENRFYRYWDNFLTEDYVTHLFRVEVSTGKIENMTPGLDKITSADGGSIDYDISPDGTLVILALNSTLPPYKDPLNMDLYMMKTSEPGVMKNITADNAADDGSPEFTSDGKSFYYVRTLNPKMVSENAKIARYDIMSGKITGITDNMDLSISSFKVSEDGSKFYFVTDLTGRVPVFEMKSDGSGLKVLYFDGVNTLPAEGKNKIFFTNQRFTYPAKIVELGSGSTELKTLFDPNKEWLDSIKFGKSEEYYFRGADGDSVQMFVIYPPDFDPAKKYGLLHLVHGGPHGAFTDDFHPRWNAQAFAAMGYVVAMVNFHGSTGFGEYFANCIVGAHGDKPFTDMTLATDFLLEKFPFIDKNRLSAAGGSYGGYLVNYMAGNTDRFAALVSHAGVFNFGGQFASDMTHFRELAYNGAPWYETDQMEKYSPHKFAKNLKTPMLVIHGEKDYRVVVTQGLELYGILTGKGVPARLLYYPDENHWILQPQNSIFWYKEIKNWLERFLK